MATILWLCSIVLRSLFTRNKEIFRAIDNYHGHKKLLKKMRGVFACGGNIENDINNDGENIGFNDITSV